MEIPTVQLIVLELPEVQIVERIQEQTVVIIKVGPQERVQQRTVEQIWDVPVPQIQEQIEEVVTNESISSFGLENSFCFFLDNTRVLSSAGMTFPAGQRLGGCSSGIGVNVRSHCQRSGETSGTIYDCNFRSSERPRRRRRRN